MDILRHLLLVADDERMIRKLVCMILGPAGHQVIEAENGLEAVVLFRAAPQTFDCVITDLDMPVMNGFELIELVQETRPLARIICMRWVRRTETA
jgi:two-component system, chemotaxis family, chemotaxis protein CheY